MWANWWLRGTENEDGCTKLWLLFRRTPPQKWSSSSAAPFSSGSSTRPTPIMGFISRQPFFPQFFPPPEMFPWTGSKPRVCFSGMMSSFQQRAKCYNYITITLIIFFIPLHSSFWISFSVCFLKMVRVFFELRVRHCSLVCQRQIFPCLIMWFVWPVPWLHWPSDPFTTSQPKGKPLRYAFCQLFFFYVLSAQNF